LNRSDFWDRQAAETVLRSHLHRAHCVRRTRTSRPVCLSPRRSSAKDRSPMVLSRRNLRRHPARKAAITLLLGCCDNELSIREPTQHFGPNGAHQSSMEIAVDQRQHIGKVRQIFCRTSAPPFCRVVTLFPRQAIATGFIPRTRGSRSEAVGGA